VNPAVEVDAGSDRYWRLTVDMRAGGLGSGLPSMDAGWRPATLTFAARGNPPFSLATGNARLVSAAIALDQLQISGSKAANGKVGTPLALLPSDAHDDAPKDADASRRYILWAALVLAVAVLAAMAWRIGRA
jgi:hypothetical protein